MSEKENENIVAKIVDNGKLIFYLPSNEEKEGRRKGEGALKVNKKKYNEIYTKRV